MESVLSGEQPAGRLQILAVMRQIDDLKNAHKRGWKFNAAFANYSIWFVETACVHTKHSIGAKAGDPFILTPTQKFLVWCLFGWRDKLGYRRFRKAYLEVARKYGKSTFAAAILLLVLVMDFPQEPEAEIYLAATVESQAMIIFNLACEMVRQSRWLRKMLTPLKKALIYSALNSVVKPLGSDSKTKDGLNPSMVLKDEYHEWQKRHEGLNDKLDTGSGARLQPLWLTTTTAGTDQSDLWIKGRHWFVQAVEAVLTDSVVDDRCFTFICCLDVKEWQCVVCKGSGKRNGRTCGVCKGLKTLPGDTPFDHKSGQDPFDPRIWTKANPNIGHSIDFDNGYRGDINEALHSPIERNKVLRYFGNVMVRSTEQLIDPILWNRNGGKPFIRDGQSCRGGIDMSRNDDFSAWALVFPSTMDESPSAEDLDNGISQLHTYDIICKCYTTEARAECLQNPLIDKWIESGVLKCHQGDQVNFSDVERDIVAASNRYSVLSWGMDRMFAAQLGQTLLNKHSIPVTWFRQDETWYNPGIRELMRALRRGDVAHGGDEVLAWQAGNLIVRRNEKDLWMPDKSHKDRKIDGIVAVLMAMSECLFHACEDDRRRSVYETRGLRTI
jgi:phage terminase large subunit-like protein